MSRLSLVLVLAACTTDEPVPDPVDTPQDTPTDTVTDTVPDDTDPPDDTDVTPATTVVWQARVPLGETLFLDGDDYLSVWGAGNGDEITLDSAPTNASATVTANRLTPDVPGTWTLARGDERAVLEVEADSLNADTFLNYNYSPTAPLVAWDADTLWVASPPSNAVQEVFVRDGELIAGRLVPTGSWPTALARWNDTLLVAQTGRDSLGLLDPVSGRVTDAIEVGDEPGGIIVLGDTAWVVLSGTDQVAEVDLVAGEVVRRLRVGNEPKAAAYDPVRQRLFVASQLSSNGTPRGPEQLVPIPVEDQHDVHVIDVTTSRVVDTIHAVGTINRGMYVDGDRLFVATSDSHNEDAQVDADSHPHSHHLTIVDLADGPTQYDIVDRLDFDRGAPVASPFSLLRHDDSLWVTASASQLLVELDPVTLDERSRTDVGHDPRGLVAMDGALVTFSWLDASVVRVDSGVATALEVGRDPTPDDIREGQRIFSDANFSRYDEFSCNNCHIDGVNDALTWDILLDGTVNTLPFRNIGGTGPFLWNGFLPTLFDFSREVLRLVGAEATGEQMAKLNRYMQSVTAPPNPNTLPGGRWTPAAERGRDLYEGAAACVGCHPAPLFTSRQVVPGKTNGLPTDVPSLIGAWDNGPWGRHGQWVTMDAMVDAALAYTGATQLTPAERADIRAYVQQIPGDILYVNSATPLDAARYVWQETPIELAFSGLLADGQEDLFALQSEDGGVWTDVAGTWTISGRYARFAPEQGPLDPLTNYRMQVTGGVAGALGQLVPEDVSIAFSTGEPPALDVSGVWRMSLPELPIGDTLDMGFIQARGGQVTGARIDSGGLIDFDNLQGHLSGSDMVIGEFVAIIEGFEVNVTEMVVPLVDDDGDGYADRGTGDVVTPFLPLRVSMERLSLPAP
jgi:DNA-binding beta-propeller fold protein YncE/mono/diheme cytochrome c family protein